MSTSSLRSLKLKLLTGYLLLVMLFGVVLTLLVYERRKVEQTTRRTEELVEQRAEAHIARSAGFGISGRTIRRLGNVGHGGLPQQIGFGRHRSR